MKKFPFFNYLEQREYSEKEFKSLKRKEIRDTIRHCKKFHKCNFWIPGNAHSKYVEALDLLDEVKDILSCKRWKER